MINLEVNQQRLEKAVLRAREQNIIIPTFRQMKDPGLIPEEIKKELAGIGLWDIHPRNLFRITWKNEPLPKGGGFGFVNYIEFHQSLTGVPARIIGLVGKWFPKLHEIPKDFRVTVTATMNNMIRLMMIERPQY